MTFTWDPAKAEANLKKHGVDFREAATVFDEPWSVAFPDSDHSHGERRCHERRFYEEDTTKDR